MERATNDTNIPRRPDVAPGPSPVGRVLAGLALFVELLVIGTLGGMIVLGRLPSTPAGLFYFLGLVLVLAAAVAFVLPREWAMRLSLHGALVGRGDPVRAAVRVAGRHELQVPRGDVRHAAAVGACRGAPADPVAVPGRAGRDAGRGRRRPPRDLGAGAGFPSRRPARRFGRGRGAGGRHGRPAGRLARADGGRGRRRRCA